MLGQIENGIHHIRVWKPISFLEIFDIKAITKIKTKSTSS
jgi:hypothetical protein